MFMQYMFKTFTWKKFLKRQVSLISYLFGDHSTSRYFQIIKAVRCCNAFQQERDVKLQPPTIFVLLIVCSGSASKS